MTDVRELWHSIQGLSENDRSWLLAQLSDWPPFRRLQTRRQRGSGHVGHSPTVVFDGGSRGNPGPGYGSYALQLDHRAAPRELPGSCFTTPLPPQVTHLEFEGGMTNNEAEYEALIQALEDLRGRLAAMGRDPLQTDVIVLGDSQLVINQVTGAWKARDPRMLQRRNRVRELLQSFGTVSFARRGREDIEEILGH